MATLSVSIAKTYRPVGHKLYGVFHHYVALAPDIVKVVVLTWRKVIFYNSVEYHNIRKFPCKDLSLFL